MHQSLLHAAAELCLSNCLPACPIELDGSVVPRASAQLHLGVHIDKNLRWSGHMDRLLKKVAGPVALCKRLIYRHRLPSSAIRKFYLAFIRLRLEYCSAVWSGASTNICRQLERIQLQVARALTYDQHLRGAQLLEKTNLPTLSWRRRVHRLV